MPSTDLSQKYHQIVVPELQKKFRLKNALAVPRVEKVVVNMGIGEASQDKGELEEPQRDLALITGQKPKIAVSRQSIAGFRLRAGAPIGLVVTLRGIRRDAFLEKLFRVVAPRLRDFQGLSEDSFDGRGNYSLGISDYTVFPEVDAAKVKKTRGLQITLITNTEDDEKAREMLKLLGLPFKK